MVKNIYEHTPLEDINGFKISKTIIDRYIYAINDLTNETVLDFGCGCGHGSALMKIYGAKKVIGYDNNPKALKEAKDNYYFIDEIYLKFTNKLDFADNTFDTITCFEVIEHINDEELNKIMIELKRICKKDGRIIISTPINRDKETLDPNHINEFNQERIKQFLSKHFNNYLLCSTANINYGNTFNLILLGDIEDYSTNFIIFIRNIKGE